MLRSSIRSLIILSFFFLTIKSQFLHPMNNHSYYYDPSLNPFLSSPPVVRNNDHITSYNTIPTPNPPTKNYNKFNPSTNLSIINPFLYTNNPSQIFRNQATQYDLQKFATLLTSAFYYHLPQLLVSNDLVSTLRHDFVNRALTLYHNLWCHRQMILWQFRGEFYRMYLIPQIRRFIQIKNLLRDHILALDKFRSKNIVIKGNGNVLTVNGRMNQNDFTSIVGKNISVSGLGNIVFGDGVTLEGERSFVMGRNLVYKGSDGIVISQNKNVVGGRRILLGGFVIEIDRYQDEMVGQLEYIEDKATSALWHV